MASSVESVWAVARNTGWSLLGQFFPLLAGFLLLPSIIERLGVDRFGLLSLVWVIMGYAGFLDLGLSRATTRFVSIALRNGRYTQTSAAVWTAVSIQVLVGIIGALGLLIGAPPLASLVVGHSSPLWGEAVAAFRNLSWGIPISLVSGSFSGALEASQRFDLSNGVRIAVSCLTYVVPALGLNAGLEIAHIVTWLVGVRAAGLFVLMALGLRIIPDLRRPSVRGISLRELLSYGGWVTVTGAFGPILMYIDRFVIGSKEGPSSVAYYSAPYDTLVRAWLIPSSYLAAIFPVVSVHEKEAVLLGPLYLESIKLVVLAGAAIFSVLIGVGDMVMKVWLGPSFAEAAAAILRILALGSMAGLIAPLSNTVLQGAGRADVLPKLYLAYFVPYLVTLLGLVNWYGVLGAALAAALRSLVDSFVLTYWAALVVRVPIRSLLESRLGRSYVLVLALAIGMAVISHIGAWSLRLVLVGLIMVAFSLSAWAFCLEGKEKTVVREFVWAARLKAVGKV